MTKSNSIILVLSVAIGGLTGSCSRAINPSHSVAISQAMQPTDLRASIIKQSQPGGKLDFFTPIKGHEYDGLQIKPGLFATRMSVALYKWGRANFDLGIKNIDDAYAIFSEFQGRILNQREKDYIKMGFTKELEK